MTVNRTQRLCFALPATNQPIWALPLDAYELEQLAAAWPGGSIRALGRLVEAVLKARDAVASRH